MSKTLYICEKPSQARDIANVLGVKDRQEGFIEGKEAIVTWCLGHLLELAPPETYCENLKPWRMAVLPVIPDKWKMVPKKKTQQQLNKIKKLLKRSNLVIIATDADREGEVIGREVLDYCNYQGKINRLWLSALDEVSIKKALADMRSGDETYPLYQSGLGRQRADWSIGMNMTMATSSLFSVRGQGVLSVGRVQTPTLALIVRRDQEIEQFKPKDYYELSVLFHAEQGEFFALWQPPEDYTDEEGRCLKRAYAETIREKITGKIGEVTEFSDKLKKVAPPLCFSLSSLQKLCSSQFGYTAKKTLEVAQSLYEKHKAISYPRTDSGYLPVDQIAEASVVLEAIAKIDNKMQSLINECDLSFRSPTWNDSKVTAHHGIIPTTNKNASMQAMSKDECQVYNLIRRHYIAQFMGNYEYTHRKVTVVCENEQFMASCKLPKVNGWKRAIDKSGEETEEQPLSPSIPKMEKSTKVKAIDSNIAEKQTKPAARFTEGTLIAAMKNIAKFVDEPELKKTLRESAGIGTEATRADIIDKIISRGFVERKKKLLISTEKGRSLISLLPDKIKNPGTTAMWEQALEDIANGKGKIDDFLLDQEDILDFMLEDLKKLKSHQDSEAGITHYPCPKCQSALIRRKGKKGYFWGCSTYPNCKVIVNDKNGKPVAT